MTGPASSQIATIDPARARQVELILERVQTLPTLSPVAARLLSIGTLDEVLIGDVVKIIESDPALSTRILGLCRKADRGLGDRITTVKRAVLMLGIESVRSAALSVSVYDLMSKEDEAARKELDAAMAGESDDSRGPGAESGATTRHSELDTPTFDRKGFWKHSIAVACAAELIAAQHLKLRVLPEEAFLAGLLHDVGRLVLDLVLPRSYARVVQLAHRRACESASIERVILGLDHHTAGRRVAEHWGLPEPIQNVIWMHGQPLDALPQTPDKKLIGVVTVAKAVCRRLHLGWSGDFGHCADPQQLWQEMGLKPVGPSSIAGPLHSAIADRLKVLGLDDTSPPGLLLESLANANKQLSDLNSALQERAQQSIAQARVLDAIDQFYSLAPGRRSVIETMAIVGVAAFKAFGPGFYAVLTQPGPDQPWQMVQLSPAGQPLAPRVLEAPPTRGTWSLSSLTTATQLNVSVLGLLPWLSEYLISAPDLRKLRLLPLVSPQPVAPTTPRPSMDDPGAPEGVVGGTSTILINDRDIAEGLGNGTLRALTATWAAAIGAASEREQSRRLGDQLAESGRTLAGLQAQLARQESLVRLGETTAGAAHEMNNPLTVITGHAQLLASRLSAPRDKAAAQTIAGAAKDLSNLISSLHLLSQLPDNKPKGLDLKTELAKAVAAARGRARRASPTTFRLEGAPATVFLDPELLAGVLVELLTNAMQACPDGPVTVSCGGGKDEEPLLIAVHDEGQGMSERALRHAFDPFFSERAAGRGRGLGLTRASRMAQAMGGQITLESTPGGGTTATLALRAWRP
jgi:signal transduction histidine kinase/HD-like signal output (HDOD) protein